MRPLPRLVPEQFCLTSAAHSLAIAAALSSHIEHRNGEMRRPARALIGREGGRHP